MASQECRHLLARRVHLLQLVSVVVCFCDQLLDRRHKWDRPCTLLPTNSVLLASHTHSWVRSAWLSDFLLARFPELWMVLRFSVWFLELSIKYSTPVMVNWCDFITNLHAFFSSAGSSFPGMPRSARGLGHLGNFSWGLLTCTCTGWDICYLCLVMVTSSMGDLDKVSALEFV